jgi:hypothetical protein
MRILLLALACLMTAHARAGDWDLDSSTTVEVLFGGKENLRLVREATSLTVYRIVDPEKKPAGKTIKINETTCESTAMVLGGADVARAVIALTRIENYNAISMCDFDPGVIVRFADKEKVHTLDLIVCFRCHEMLIIDNGKLVRREDRLARSKIRFGPAIHDILVAIATKAFPKDTEIQKLKAK